MLSINAIIGFFAGAGRAEKLSDTDEAYSVASVVSSDKFTRLTTSSSKHPNFSRDSVRRAVYLTVVSLCNRANAIVAAKEDFFGKAILGAIGEKSPGNAEEMLNAVLTFLQTCPSVWADSPTFAKFAVSAVYPRLFSQIRHGFYGSAPTSFPSLLPLLSLIPLDVVLDPKTGRSALYTGVLDNCLKYLESSDAKFHGNAGITAFFECLTAFVTIFLNRKASGDWLSELEEDVVSNYARQFEKAIGGSLRLALSSVDLSDDLSSHYVAELLKMHTRVSGYAAGNPVATSIKNAYVESLLGGLHEQLLAMVSSLSIEPTRFSILLRKGLAGSSNEAGKDSYWLSVGQAVYHQAVDQLHSFATDPVFSVEKCSSLSRLLNVIETVHSAISLQSLALDGSPDSHFAEVFRPIICMLSGWVKIDRKKSEKATQKLLAVSRQFFLGAADKKAFLLQLFKDFDVQFGDMVDATAIIQHALQFPITDERCQLWSTCGSWQQEQTSVETTDATMEGLCAIWKGKLLDEFLMISLKGRLDDLDPESFTRLLGACLGGVSSCPLLSPDAVVIFCHYVAQNGSDSPGVLMQIVRHLCVLFVKLSGDLPSELESVEAQLYTQLFHLSARGSYRTEASALWEETVKKSLQLWKKDRAETFVTNLAKHVNGLLVEEATDKSVFNSKLFTAYAKKYLLLSLDDVVPADRIVAKLDFIHASCQEGSSRPLFFNRMLVCFGEICEDERVVAIIKDYILGLYEKEPTTAVKIVSTLVDIDVSHAMTLFVFHPQDNDSTWGRTSSRLEVLESYLTLEPMYESLRPTRVFNDALEAMVRHENTNGVEHRDLIIASKADESRLPIDATISAETRLAPAQHEEIDCLIVSAMSLFATTSYRASLVVQVLNEGGDSYRKVTLEPVIVSLVNDYTGDKRQGGDAEHQQVSDTLRKFFDACSTAALASNKLEDCTRQFRVVASCWHAGGAQGVSSGEHSLDELFPVTTLVQVLSKMEAFVSAGSTSVVEANEWVRMADYASTIPLSIISGSEDLRSAWERVVRMLIIHAFAGKQEVSKVAVMKIHKRNAAISQQESSQDEQFLPQPLDQLVRTRTAMLNLLGALAQAKSELLHELTAFYREALLSTVLCTFAESAEISASLITAYVGAGSPSVSFELVQLSLATDASFKSVFRSIHLALTSIADAERVRELVLEAFGGIDGLAALFNASRYPMTPAQRVLLYIVTAFSGALRSRSLSDTSIDLNADDEAATEAAVAKVLIPKALRKALRAVFVGGEEAAATKIRMRSRRQKPQEREDLVGRLLLWDLFLQLFPRGTTAGGEAEDAASGMIGSALSSYATNHNLLSNFLGFCAELLSQESAASLVKKQQQHTLDLQNVPLFGVGDLELEQSAATLATLSFDKSSVFLLGTRVFFRTAVRLPAMVRTWWNDECTRSVRSWAAKYFEDNISPFMLASELDVIQSASEAAEAWDEDEMTVKGSRVSREITTTYMKDECALEMVIRVPAAYPLRCVEVECTKRIGIAEDRWRRWVLQIIKVTSSQDGSLLDAVLLWKKNVDKEFEGVEPCPICYSILNPKTMGLPNLPCKTCSNKYHNSCLYKWFNQSGKNKCPICQQPFY